MTMQSDRAFVPLVGRWVRLEPLRSTHVGDIHGIVSHGLMTDEWPQRELNMNPSQFERSLWTLCELNYVVVRLGTDETIGFLQGINSDPVNGTIGLGIALRPEVWRQGWPWEAVVIFIHVLFEVHGFRKIYCQMSERTRTKVGSAIHRWLHHEATYRRHERRGNEYDDWHIYALYRTQWPVALIGQVTGGQLVAQAFV